MVTPKSDRIVLRRLGTDELTAREVRAIRRLLVAAFGSQEEEAFTEDDWQHALGGLHFVIDIHGEVVAHAAVVERELHVDGRRLRTGYVEAVATAVKHRGMGLGTMVMREVGYYIQEHFELGALGTGRHGFYQRLGWLTWQGPSSVRSDTGMRPTPEEDGYILVLQTPSSPPLDVTAPISCQWRSGDVW